MDLMQDKIIDKMTSNGTEDSDYIEKNTKPVTAKASTKKEVKDTKLKKRDKSKTEAKPKEKKEKQLSNINLMKQLLKDKLSDEEIVKTFTKRYKEKGVTDKDFIAKRIKIYKKIASA